MYRLRPIPILCLLFLFTATLTLLPACSDDDPTLVEPVGERTWRVPDDWPTLQAAADTAHAGDTIVLAPGIYREVGVVLEAGVDLRGETTREGGAVLDGQLLGQVLTVAPDTVSAAHDDTTCEIANLEIRGGTGALYIKAAAVVSDCRFAANHGEQAAVGTLRANVAFVRCAFDSNTATDYDATGGALLVEGTAEYLVTVNSCSFTYNQVEWGAGGAACFMAPAEIDSTTFAHNRALSGGAIVTGQPVEFADCAFTDNTADGVPGDGGDAFGGALYLIGGEQRLVRCDFVGNHAMNGSAIMGSGSDAQVQICAFSQNVADGAGTINWAGDCDPSFLRCDIVENQADYGGGFKAWGGANPTFTDCSISGNAAGAGGAGEFGDQGTLSLLACRLESNTSQSFGGALAVLSTAADVTPQLIMSSCTVSGNSAVTAGGGFFFGLPAHLQATETTFAGNTAPEYAGGMVGWDGEVELICCTFTDQEIGGNGTVTVDDTDCGSDGGR